MAKTLISYMAALETIEPPRRSQIENLVGGLSMYFHSCVKKRESASFGHGVLTIVQSIQRHDRHLRESARNMSAADIDLARNIALNFIANGKSYADYDPVEVQANISAALARATSRTVAQEPAPQQSAPVRKSRPRGPKAMRARRPG